MIVMKRIVSLLAALVLFIFLFGLQSAALAQNANPHAAEWLDETMAASLDTLKRVDEAGLFYEMTCDYDYNAIPSSKRFWASSASMTQAAQRLPPGTKRATAS